MPKTCRATAQAARRSASGEPPVALGPVPLLGLDPVGLPLLGLDPVGLPLLGLDPVGLPLLEPVLDCLVAAIGATAGVPAEDVSGASTPAQACDALSRAATTRCTSAHIALVVSTTGPVPGPGVDAEASDAVVGGPPFVLLDDPVGGDPVVVLVAERVGAAVALTTG